MVSGSDYSTANLYLSEVYIIKELLNSKQFDSDYFIGDMVVSMKRKFDKYWGEVNLLMVLAAILDPRGKLMFVKFVFNELHSTNEAAIKLKEVKNSLYEVFDYYVEAHNATTIEHSSSSQASASNQSSIEDSLTYSTKSTSWKKFDQFVRMVESTPAEK